MLIGLYSSMLALLIAINISHVKACRRIGLGGRFYSATFPVYAFALMLAIPMTAIGIYIFGPICILWSINAVHAKDVFLWLVMLATFVFAILLVSGDEAVRAFRRKQERDAASTINADE